MLDIDSQRNKYLKQNRGKMWLNLCNFFIAVSKDVPAMEYTVIKEWVSRLLKDECQLCALTFVLAAILCADQ